MIWFVSVEAPRSRGRAVPPGSVARQCAVITGPDPVTPVQTPLVHAVEGDPGDWDTEVSPVLG